MQMDIRNLTLSIIDNEVIVNETPASIIVLVYLEHCGFCPSINNLLTSMANEVNVGRVNASQHLNIMRFIGLQQVPVILAFKNHRLVNALADNFSKQNILALWHSIMVNKGHVNQNSQMITSNVNQNLISQATHNNTQINLITKNGAGDNKGYCKILY
jgi:thioredoxin-like negative regulator of GroEL